MKDTLTTAEVVAWLAAVTGSVEKYNPAMLTIKLDRLNCDIQEGIVPLLTDDDYNAAFALSPCPGLPL